MFKSGFVNIVGLPNVGKSSLINLLIEDKLSIVNSKAQTTRQNIKGFIQGEDHQIILIDTPGFIDEPAYQLQLNMNSYVDLALNDADIIVFVVDKFNILDAEHPLINAIKKAKKNTILIVNKADLSKPEDLIELEKHYKDILDLRESLFMSVDLKYGREELVKMVLDYLPEHPPYFNQEDWTDRNMRFFASEIIRERVFSNYQKEIPYSSEVDITKYQERDSGDVLIEANVYVERDSQKGIIIGHNGEMIKKISAEARAEIESYTGTKVHLFIFVKVLKDWRNKENILNRFGYNSPKKDKNQ